MYLSQTFVAGANVMFDANIAFAPSTPLKMNTVNLNSGAFVVIMLLNERLTRVHSQKDPGLQFSESFTSTDESVTLTPPNSLHKSQQVFPAGRTWGPAPWIMFANRHQWYNFSPQSFHLL